MTQGTAAPTIHERIRDGLSRLAMVLRIDEWNRAKVSGLNPTQMSILTLLSGRGGGLGVKEIATHLGVSQPTATDSIGALERKGLVEKQASAGDRRAVDVLPTAKGTALADVPAEASLAARAIGCLEDREQEDLLLLLIKMIRHLQETDAIPVQRMCVTCRHFAPFTHSDAARPHYCHFVDAAFGARDLRIDCREHDNADPADRAATRKAFRTG